MHVLYHLILCCCCVKWLQSCPSLCDFMDCSLPGSPLHGNLQARIPEWVAMPSSRDQTHTFLSPALAGRFFTISATWEALLTSYILQCSLFSKNALFPKEHDIKWYGRS